MKTIQKFLRENSDVCATGRAWLVTQANMETAWRNCRNVQWMFWALARLEIEIDPVTARLLACRFVRETPLADGRMVWNLLTDERSRAAVIVAERFARGAASDDELSAARSAAADAARSVAIRSAAVWSAARSAADAARSAAVPSAADAVRSAAVWSAAAAAADDDAEIAQANILRATIQNPWAK